MLITLRVRSVAWFATGVVLTLFVGLVVTQAWRVDAAPGDADTTFVPIAPCRLVDTRPVPLRVGTTNQLGAAATSTVQATGTNGQCTIPLSAVGLSMNVTALGATADTFLTFWAGGTRPGVASLTPYPGQGGTPNAVNAPLNATGAFSMYNNLGTVNVVIDVNGYYTKESLQQINARLLALESPRAAVVADPSSNVVDQTSSTTYADLPSAATNVTTVANGRLLVEFSTEAQCSTPDPVTTNTGWCQVRVLVDGNPVNPADAVSLSKRSFDPATDSGYQSTSHQFVTAPLTAGVHTVKVQYHVNEANMTFSVDNWLLSATPLTP